MTSLLQQALTEIAGLSAPPDMPCYSWGLPPESCITGRKLRNTDPESPCAKCYAQRGHYRRPAAIAARDRRLARLNKALARQLSRVDFVHAFAYVLNYRGAKLQKGTKDPAHFRWFDSGDLQSVAHADIIKEIAIHTPDVTHWLPTRERQFLSGFVAPSNLVVRLSCNKIDQGYDMNQSLGFPTSAIHTEPNEQPKGYIECQSKLFGVEICQSCRDCWDPTVHISYLKR